MARRKFRWNKYYLAISGILFFGLTYFLLPRISKNETITPVIEIVKQYGINPLLDHVILPLNQGMNRLNKSLTDPLNDQGVQELKNQVANLRRQLEVKDYLIQRLNHLDNENQALRSLLGYRSNIGFSVVPAKIISYQPQNHFYSFWIDAGKNQSLDQRMPVIAFNSDGEQGLVGFVTETLDDSSLIQTILDPQTHVGITLEGYETKAILKGDLHFSRLLVVDFINHEFTNLEGRHVYTSGIGERYPQGIQIGKITSSDDSLYGIFQSAKVNPIIDFTSLKHVLVIIPGAPKISKEDD